ncbi:hypothetical protein BU16DRAFT_579 [Lophium mytilinum]|uniref:RRM domain-containing protein n=1 Tax=Lophium mytilinum TaxID=390894 RepID=A0A6A6RBT6_9PEZI|nr:hypothetical protein BU16DRAFT_579 [Lophium mytilinum]
MATPGLQDIEALLEEAAEAAAAKGRASLWSAEKNGNGEHNRDRDRAPGRCCHSRGNFPHDIAASGHIPARSTRPRRHGGSSQAQRQRHPSWNHRGNVPIAQFRVRMDPVSSPGDVYIKFVDLAAGTKSLNALNSRYFNKHMITVAPVSDAMYKIRFPDSEEYKGPQRTQWSSLQQAHDYRRAHL